MSDVFLVSDNLLSLVDVEMEIYILLPWVCYKRDVCEGGSGSIGFLRACIIVVSLNLFFLFFIPEPLLGLLVRVSKANI